MTFIQQLIKKCTNRCKLLQKSMNIMDLIEHLNKKTLIQVKQNQAGAVLIENASGKIISFVGNRDASVDNHFNFAMNAKRRPGSTFKPLAVYAPGMDLGILQPATILADVPDRPGYSPENYGKTH